MTSYTLILIIVCSMIFLLCFVEPIISRQKLKNNNEHGSARWSTKKEIKKNFDKEKLNNIQKAGFPIYYSFFKKYAWFDNITPHWLYIGATGSGKTATSVLPECSFFATSKIKKSLFITDPKGEIFEKTSKMFTNNGYKILTLDFRHPELSNHLNILNPIIKEYELFTDYSKKSIEEKDENKKMLLNNNAIIHLAECDQLVTSLSSMIMNDQTAKEKFWNNSATDLLYGLIFLFLEEYADGKINREQITLTSVKKFQSSSMTEHNMKKLKTYIEKKEYGNKSKDKLQPLLNISDTTYRSITSTFNERMRLFDDINVENITSNSDFDFNILGQEPTVLYCCIPDENKIYYSLISIIVSLIYKSLVLLANEQESKRLPYELVFMLDEFANTPPLTDIETIVSVARSRGMWFRFFIQSFAQLDNLYGKEISQVIQDNCGLVYLKTNTQDTAQAISTRLGNKTIQSSSLNYSLGYSNANGSKSTSLMSRSLLTPDEIRQLEHRTIIFPSKDHPIFRKTVLYKKFKCYEKGYIEREKRPLERLTNTYFTVEQIKTVNQQSNTNPQQISAMEQQQRGILNKIIDEIIKIFGKVDFDTEFVKKDENVGVEIYLAPPLSLADITKLEELSKKMAFSYHAVSSQEEVNVKNRNSKIEINLK